MTANNLHFRAGDAETTKDGDIESIMTYRLLAIDNRVI
jgi:hypothetical protein